MRKRHGFTAVAAFVIATLGISAHAADDPHHPAGAAPALLTPSARSPTRAAMMPVGMDGMSGTSPMIMMTRMMDMMNSPGSSIMDATDHIEGRIAYLRAELQITDEPGVAWHTFAQALRATEPEPGRMRTADSGANGKRPQATGGRTR
mgnify:CR=1 FL=1